MKLDDVQDLWREENQEVEQSSAKIYHLKVNQLFFRFPCTHVVGQDFDELLGSAQVRTIGN